MAKKAPRQFPISTFSFEHMEESTYAARELVERLLHQFFGNFEEKRKAKRQARIFSLTQTWQDTTGSIEILSGENPVFQGMVRVVGNQIRASGILDPRINGLKRTEWETMIQGAIQNALTAPIP